MMYFIYMIVFLALSMGSCIGGGYAWDVGHHGLSVAAFLSSFVFLLIGVASAKNVPGK